MIVPFLIIFPLIVVALLVYLIPSLISFHRDNENKLTVLAVNALTGWTLVGWVVALVMAIKG